jgi:two-component system sensor histidine kinase KdpD
MAVVSPVNAGRLRDYLLATVALAALIVVLHALRSHLNQTSIALALVLLVVLVAVRAGRWPALYSSILAGLAFNFFFIGPFYTLRIQSAEDVVAYIVFVTTAILVGQLSSRLEKRIIEADQLQRSEQLKTALLDAVTHDLRTPLTAIKAAITTLREENIDRDVQQELEEVIEQEADRLNHFIQGMMDLARLEAGRLSLQSRAVSADEVVEYALLRASPLLREREVETAIEPGLPQLRADPRLISQVLFTLIENASKYSPAGSPIEVSVGRSGGSFISFAVCDHGSGIAPELRNQVFQKFFRSGAQPGFGVGLAIAHGIVQAHRGRIWIESAANGTGTRVQFQIPAGEAA